MRPFLFALMVCGASWCTEGRGQTKPPESGESLQVLVERLKSSHAVSERVRAAEAVAVYGQKAVKPLIELLHSDDPRTQYYACVALTRIGPVARDATPDLTALAAESTAYSQAAAVVALGRIGPAAIDSAPVLLQLVRTGSCEVRESAIGALSRMEPAVMPLLLNHLKGDDAAEIRSACAVVGRMGPKGKQAVPALVALAHQADEEVRYAVFLALTGIGTAALSDLTCMLRNEDASVRRLAAMVISELGGDGVAALSAICDASCDRDAGVRFWAVRALGRIGKTDAEVANCLVRTAKDEDADVRWQTAVTLHEIGVSASTRQALASLQNDAHPAVRAQARRAQ